MSDSLQLRPAVLYHGSPRMPERLDPFSAQFPLDGQLLEDGHGAAVCATPLFALAVFMALAPKDPNMLVGYMANPYAGVDYFLDGAAYNHMRQSLGYVATLDCDETFSEYHMDFPEGHRLANNPARPKRVPEWRSAVGHIPRQDQVRKVVFADLEQAICDSPADQLYIQRHY